MKTVSLFVPLLTAVFVSAHGYLNVLTINGNTKYYGNNPDQPENAQPTIVRATPINPLTHADNVNLACGVSPKKASLVANVNPGDSISISWSGGGGENVRFHL